MGEINLLQQEKKSAFRPHADQLSGRVFIWVMAGIILLEMIGYGVVYFWKQKVTSSIESLEASIVQLDQKLKTNKADVNEAVKAQSALNAFATLLDGHVHWTRAWNELSKTALKSAQYVSLQAAADNGELVIKGEVANYTELGKVLLGLQTSSNFTSVELLSSGPAEGEKIGVQFEIQVKMKSLLLLRPSSK